MKWKSRLSFTLPAISLLIEESVGVSSDEIYLEIDLLRSQAVAEIYELNDDGDPIFESIKRNVDCLAEVSALFGEDLVLYAKGKSINEIDKTTILYLHFRALRNKVLQFKDRIECTWEPHEELNEFESERFQSECFFMFQSLLDQFPDLDYISEYMSYEHYCFDY